MQINGIRLGVAAALVSAAGIGAGYIILDRKQASYFKDGIRTEILNYNGFPSIYDYKKAELEEPFFNQAHYWEVIADSLRRELQNAKAKDNRIQFRSPEVQ